MSSDRQTKKSTRLYFHTCACCGNEGLNQKLFSAEPTSEPSKNDVDKQFAPIEGINIVSEVSGKTMVSDARTQAMGNAFSDFKL